MNKFSRENFPRVEPREMRHDVLWTWQRPDLAADYSPDSYELSYKFISLDGGADFEHTAVVDNGNFVIEFTPSDLRAGKHRWVAFITETSTSRRVVVNEGFIDVLAGDGEDAASHTYKTLMAIRATIQKTATKEQSSYSIAGRALSRRTLEELQALEREYLSRWNNEKRAMDRKNGRKPKSRTVRARF